MFMRAVGANTELQSRGTYRKLGMPGSHQVQIHASAIADYDDLTK